MPELPEVETIRLGLQKKIIGLTIKKVQILSPKSFIGKKEEVENKRVIAVFRRAKILGIDVGDSSPSAQNDKGFTLLFHLKMSGQLIYEDEKRFIGGHPTEDMMGKMPNSHTRVIFSFSDPLRREASGSKLYFNDQRKFGWVKTVQSSKIKDQSFFKDLGPEPLKKEFTWKILKSNLLNHKSQPVKVAIMDQSVVAGIGNIYANEACFDAGLSPQTKVKELTDEQFEKLHHGIITSLTEGIKHGGSTRAHFVDTDGRKGYFLDYAFVYGRDKQPCKKCKTEIRKIQLAGRGTYFCPKCQR